MSSFGIKLNINALDSMGFTRLKPQFGNTQGSMMQTQRNGFQQQMNTTSLLQNTPMSVYRYKQDHLEKTKEIHGNPLNRPGAISPIMGLGPSGEISATQSRFFSN